MRKFISCLTAACLCFSLLPHPSHASGTQPAQQQNTITASYYIDENNDVYQWLPDDLYTTNDMINFDPIKVEGLSNVVDIDGIPSRGAAVTADGSLYTWGYSDEGVLGLGDVEHQETPAKVQGISNVVSVSIATYGGVAIAVTADGSVYTWGRIYVGDSKNWHPLVKTYTTPHKVAELSDVVAVDCNNFNFAAITKNGDLYMWGQEFMGENGYGKFMSSAVPRKILSQVSSVSIGRYTACAVTTDGTLYTWGTNDEYALGRPAVQTHGNGRYGDPTPAPALRNIKEARMGDTFYGMAIDNDGQLYVWGDYGNPNRDKSELSYFKTETPLPIECDQKFVSLAIGRGNNAAVTEEGDLYGWFGTLAPAYLLSGVKVPSQTTLPQPSEAAPLPQVNPYRTVAPGYVVLQNGDLYRWAPDAAVEEGTSLQKVEGISNVVDISVRVDLGSHAPETVAAITAEGSLYTWGKNDEGQLALGDKADRDTPTKVDLDNVVSVSLGVYSRGAALTSSGDMYVWGLQYRGDDKKYNPIYEEVLKPQKVKSLSDVISISCGSYNYGAVTRSGELYTWGSDSDGVNGYKTRQSSAVPRKILENVQSVELGRMTGSAITRDGSLYTWGTDAKGHTAPPPDGSPFKVGIPPVKYATIGESFYMAAITKDGELYMWGNAKIDRQDGGFDKSAPTLIAYDGGKPACLSLGWGYSQMVTEDGGL